MFHSHIVAGRRAAPYHAPAAGDYNPGMTLPRFQFRLRTLLLIVAIVAIQCAVCLPSLKEWQKRRDLDEARREAVEELQGCRDGSSSHVERLAITKDNLCPQVSGPRHARQERSGRTMAGARHGFFSLEWFVHRPIIMRPAAGARDAGAASAPATHHDP